MIFLNSRKYVHRGIKVNMKTGLVIESSHATCLQPYKLEKISFNNIVAMKINAVFECISIHSTPADTSLDTSRYYQI